jgi:hypothetical protein
VKTCYSVKILRFFFSPSKTFSYILCTVKSPFKFCLGDRNSVRSEAFMTAEVDKIFSGYQLCQLVKNYQRFKDCLSPSSGSDVT